MQLQKEKSAPLASLILGGVLAFVLGALCDGNILNGFAVFGSWLRELSLSGSGGNIAAWALVIAASALPALGLLRKNRQKADLLLAVCSAEIFALLYYLVNPTLNAPIPVGMDPAMARQGWGLVAGSCVVGTALSWAFLRLLARLPRNASELMPKLLRWAAVVFIFFLGFVSVRELMAQMQAVEQANTAGSRVQTTKILLAVLALLDVLPGLLGGYVLLMAAELAGKLDASPFEEETVSLAEFVAAQCISIAKCSLILSVAGNALQLIVYSMVASVHVTAKLPLLTLALCAVLLVLCRYFRRAKAVSDDNASII